MQRQDGRVQLQRLKTVDQSVRAGPRTTAQGLDRVYLHDCSGVAFEDVISAPRVEIGRTGSHNKALGHARILEAPEVPREQALRRHVRGVHRGARRQRAAVAMQPLSTRGARAAGASLLTGIDCNAVLLEPLGPHRVCAEQLVPEIRDGSVQARAQHEGQRLVRRVCVQRQRNVAEAGAHENQNAEASMNSYDRPARRHVKWTLIYEIEEGQYL